MDIQCSDEVKKARLEFTAKYIAYPMSIFTGGIVVINALLSTLAFSKTELLTLPEWLSVTALSLSILLILLDVHSATVYGWLKTSIGWRLLLDIIGFGFSLAALVFSGFSVSVLCYYLCGCS